MQSTINAIFRYIKVDITMTIKLCVMTNGVRATVSFDSPGVCPLSALSTDTNTRISGITNSISNNASDPAITEFTLEEAIDPLESIEPLYSYSSGVRYRLTHTGDDDCPCKILGSFGTAPAHYEATDGQLTIVFYAINYERLQLIIGALRDTFDSLDIKQLTQSSQDPSKSSEIPLNIGKLTDRQLEVLQTAFEMGYFNRPRNANAAEVAAALNIHPSTFNEHLAVTQTKLFRDILRNASTGSPITDTRTH